MIKVHQLSSHFSYAQMVWAAELPDWRGEEEGWQELESQNRLKVTVLTLKQCNLQEISLF